MDSGPPLTLGGSERSRGQCASSGSDIGSALAIRAAAGPVDSQIRVILYRKHATILGRQVSEIERLLNPVLRPLGGSLESAARVALSSASWQPATEELLRGARHVETLLAVMLGAAPGEAAS